MRRLGLGLLGLLLALAIAFFTLAPGYFDRTMNLVDESGAIAVSDEARALHDTLTIVDLHADTLLWKRDMLDRVDHSHVDLPRLIDGNVALQVFSSVTKTPENQNYESNTDETDRITLLAIGQLQPVRTWGSLLERTLWHGTKLDRAVEGSGGALVAIRDGADVAALLAARGDAARPVGAMLSVEGLHNLEGDIANLDALYDAGVRMAGLAHFFDNEVAGSMHGVTKGGLTSMGRETVRRMEAMGMVVDIAHCSHQCVAEVLAMARRPVVSSHGGVQATCAVNRNLTDEEIRGVAATGGLIGVGYWPAAVCGLSPHAIARAMRHVRDLVGIEHVALGSDFDGTVETAFDTAGVVQVTQALLDEGFSEEEIRAAMGGNALRVLAAGIEPMQGSD
ncbi:peptidase M19 [Alteraurantiacibacter aquimixticola]|uniref:Peptidase M19 n=1 Tax=Alteraurantiacibacter aquimixticola TaxID=2489173 RepID=A0A4T3EYY8_9SPHN|nr:dipeptidase [Alteraurantiacibacter aquimixticola]TIX49311.1 peptidase M19 [Alteraurantiacibacter aquimixticola]